MHRAIAIAVVLALLAVPALAWAIPQVTGADVVDDSLTGADVLESSLATVPSATFGGVRTMVRRSAFTEMPPDDVLRHAEVGCPSGWVPTGGGFDGSGFDAGVSVVGSSIPVEIGQPPVWRVSMRNAGGHLQAFRAVVLCAEGTLVN